MTIARLVLSLVVTAASLAPAAAVPFDPSLPKGQGTPPALRVVVIEGEGSVNIIQQKTAVRPIVEVRDRNNLPVPGALVTFSIEGGKAATFGGASTLTVATNAAGQAAVTSLTPGAAGAFQIQVSAAFQGQVATATIAQTNVMTAAQAAAAGAASSGGGGAGSAGGGGTGGAGGAGGGAGGAGGAAGGAGGGLSATTIGVVGAAVAGGAVAATQVAGQEEPTKRSSGPSTFTGSFSGPFTSTNAGGPNGSIVCTINRTVNGGITLTLETETAAAVNGPLRVTGTDTVVSSTCRTVPETSQINESFTVTGTPQRLGFTETRREQRQEGSVVFRQDPDDRVRGRAQWLDDHRNAEGRRTRHRHGRSGRPRQRNRLRRLRHHADQVVASRGFPR
jgi:hypothetical protein